MTIKAARLKDRHAVHPEDTESLTMAVRTLGIVLLFSFVTALSGLPTIAPEPAVRTHEERTLATDLQPPPLDENEHHATVFIINLYAVKNSSGNTSEEMFENEVIQTVPDILEPLATVLLVVEDKEDEADREEKEKHFVDLDEFAEGLQDQGFKVDKIDYNGKTKVLKMNMENEKVQRMVESASMPVEEKKARKKRTICLKCKGGRGGYGGGGYGGYPPSGGGCPTCGGHYPSGGGGCPTCGGQGYQTAVVPVVIVPVNTGYHRGGGRHHYPSGGGGVCNTCGGGGGGGGSWSQSSASAQSSSGSWGGK